MTTTGKRETRRTRVTKPLEKTREVGHVAKADSPRTGWNTLGNGGRSRAVIQGD